jgi:hypothetical protein
MGQGAALLARQPALVGAGRTDWAAAGIAARPAAVARRGAPRVAAAAGQTAADIAGAAPAASEPVGEHPEKSENPGSAAPAGSRDPDRAETARRPRRRDPQRSATSAQWSAVSRGSLPWHVTQRMDAIVAQHRAPDFRRGILNSSLPGPQHRFHQGEQLVGIHIQRRQWQIRRFVVHNPQLPLELTC